MEVIDSLYFKKELNLYPTSSYPHVSPVSIVFFPRKMAPEVFESIEEERNYRIANSNVDPYLYSKILKCQTEMMHRLIPTTILNDARATINGQLFYAKESTKRNSTTISMKYQDIKNNLEQFFKNWRNSTSEMIHEIDVKSKEFSISTNHHIDNITNQLSKTIQLIDSKTVDFAIATNQYENDINYNISDDIQEVDTQSQQFAITTNREIEEIKSTIDQEKEHIIETLRKDQNQEDLIPSSSSSKGKQDVIREIVMNNIQKNNEIKQHQLEKVINTKRKLTFDEELNLMSKTAS